MPLFKTSEIEKANLKFIELVKKYPCIWDRFAVNYKNRTDKDEAWAAIAKEMSDTPKTCLLHWQKIRRAYSRSFRANEHGIYQRSEYYLANALEFVRPHVKQSCGSVGDNDREGGGGGGGGCSEEVTSDADDSLSRTSITSTKIKDEPEYSEDDDTHIKNAEEILFDIIKMEDKDDEDEGDKMCHGVKEALPNSSSNKRKRQTDSIADVKRKDTTQGAQNEHPNLSLIDANRKFFESLIPFIDDMNTQQNRRFRREMMCLIDDVLDDRDIDGRSNSS